MSTAEQRRIWSNQKAAQRALAKENAEKENTSKSTGKKLSDKIEFVGKKINTKKFKEAYEEKVKGDACKYFIYQSVLDVVPLIVACKECISKNGAFIKATTGGIKANPAQKELRENTKAFTSLLEQLNSMLGDDEKPDLSAWLDDDDE